MKHIKLYPIISVIFVLFGLSVCIGKAGDDEEKKILFVLSSHSELGNTGKETGYFLSEAAHPWHVLTQAGYSIDFVSPKGGNPPVDGFDLDDPINKEFWENKQVRKKLKNTLTPEQVDVSKYEVIHFVGGHGTMWDFPDNKKLSEIAATIYEKGGVVSAVCHGPAGLLNVKLSDGRHLIQDKKVAAFTNEEEKAAGLDDVVPFLLEDALEAKGAEHIDAPNWKENVQVSDRLITGQNPASATKVGEKIVKLLEKQ